MAELGCIAVPYKGYENSREFAWAAINALSCTDKAVADSMAAQAERLGVDCGMEDVNGFLQSLGTYCASFSFQRVSWGGSIAANVRRDCDIEGDVKARMALLLERNSRERFRRRGQYIVGLCDRHGVVTHHVAVGNLRGYGMVVMSPRRRWCVNLCEDSLISPAGDHDEDNLPASVGVAAIHALARDDVQCATAIPGALPLSIAVAAPPYESTVYLAPYAGRNPPVCVPIVRMRCGMSPSIAFPHQGDRYDFFWACANAIVAINLPLGLHFASHRTRLANDVGVLAINRYLRQLGTVATGYKFESCDWVHAIEPKEEIECRYTIGERKRDVFITGLEERRYGYPRCFVVSMIDAEGRTCLHVAVEAGVSKILVKNPYARYEHEILPESIVQMPQPDDDYVVASGVGEVYELVCE